ncbi:MAG TPA: glyoxalase superfamily protein [Terriglobales bacterium]|nr:glyoxalase superfamily protein [Terriglobales bacterium]
MVSFECVFPILRVKNMKRSLKYYLNKLGFKLDFGGPGGFASVSRDKCAICLAEGDQGHLGGWVWIGVKDTAALHQELKAKGAKIANPPTNFPWALEMQVADPDGNILRMGSEPLPGKPFGPWRDMRGDRWEAVGEGWKKWRRVPAKRSKPKRKTAKRRRAR